MKIKKIDINPDLYGLKCPRTLLQQNKYGALTEIEKRYT